MGTPIKLKYNFIIRSRKEESEKAPHVGIARDFQIIFFACGAFSLSDHDTPVISLLYVSTSYFTCSPFQNIRYESEVVV